MIVWIASYPRSGNTLLRIMLNNVFGVKTYSIHNDELDIGANQKTSDVVGHLCLDKELDLDQLRSSEEYVYIKTHLLPDKKIHERDKVIYLIRDGRESIVSYHHYIKNFAKRDVNLLAIICGKVVYGGWGRHVKRWNPKHRLNTIYIRFEDIILDKEKHIDIISKFLNITPRSSSYPSFEQLNAINPKFFRSGKTDSWKKEFGLLDHWIFWLVNKEIMYSYGYINMAPFLFRH